MISMCQPNGRRDSHEEIAVRHEEKLRPHARDASEPEGTWGWGQSGNSVDIRPSSWIKEAAELRQMMRNHTSEWQVALQDQKLEIQALKRQLDDMRSAEEESLKAQIKQVKLTTAELTVKLNSMEDLEEETLRQQIQTIHNLSDTDKEAKLSTLGVRELREKMRQTQAQVQSVGQARHEEIQARHDEIQAQHDEMSSRSAEIHARQNELAARTANAQARIDARQDEIHSRLSELQTNHDEVRAHAKEMHARNEELKARQEEMQAKADELARADQTRQEHILELRNELLGLNGEKDKLNKRDLPLLRQELSVIRADVQSKTCELRAEIAALREELRREIEVTSIKTGHLALTATSCDFDERRRIYTVLKTREKEISEAVSGITTYATGSGGQIEYSGVSALSPGAATLGLSPVLGEFDPNHEFEVKVDRSYGEVLGAELDGNDGKVLRVIRLKDGILRKWNRQCEPPNIPVNSGDLIVQVNGVRGSASLMLKELEKRVPLTIVFLNGSMQQ